MVKTVLYCDAKKMTVLENFVFHLPDIILRLWMGFKVLALGDVGSFRGFESSCEPLWDP